MTTGTDVIREKVRIVAFKGHLAPLARDLNVGIAALEAFATGHAALPIPILQKLTVELWGGTAEYDPQSNLLRSANRAEPKLLGVRGRVERLGRAADRRQPVGHRRGSLVEPEGYFVASAHGRSWHIATEAKAVNLRSVLVVERT